MDLSKRTLIGIALILVGAVLLVPATGVAATGAVTILLVPATIILTAGTYLVGTDVAGSPA
jgi:uncharacterized membrane protein